MSFPGTGAGSAPLLLIPALLSLPFLPAALGADELQLKNGDQVSGTIESMDEETVEIRTDYGLLTIQRRYVETGTFQSLSSETEGTGTEADTEAAPAPPFPEDTLLHLPLDGSLKDAAGAFHPEKRGDLTFGTGRGGREKGAAVSNGDGSYAEIPAGEDLNSLQTFTLAFWFRGELPESARFLVSKWKKTSGQTAEGKFSLSLSRNGIFCYLTDAEGRYHTLGAKPPSGMDSGEWHHLAVTHREGAAALYINGELAADKQFPYEKLLNDAAPLQLFTARAGDSGDWGRFNFEGRMDDFILYDRVLSAGEIAQSAGNSSGD